MSRSVLFLGAYPPPFGGISSHLHRFVPHLLDRGYNCQVIAPGENRAIEDRGPFPVYRVPKTFPDAFRTLSARPFASVRDIVRSGSLHHYAVEASYVARVADSVIGRHGLPSLLSAYHILPWGLAAHLTAHRWRVPYIVTNFGEIYSLPDVYARLRALVSRIAADAAALLASSDHCARSYGTLGLDARPETVPYGIDTDLFSEPDAAGSVRPHVPAGTSIVLFLGRFIPDMGADTFLQAARVLLDGHERGLHFWMAGASGPLFGEAERLARDFPERVTVERDVPFERLPLLYASSDVVATPTSDDRACMGLAIKEAMAVGRPVVACAVGGVPEAVVDGETGVLIPPRDPNALAAAILRLHRAPEEARAMGRRARARALRLFSIERTHATISEIFSRVAREDGGPRSGIPG